MPRSRFSPELVAEQCAHLRRFPVEVELMLADRDIDPKRVARVEVTRRLNAQPSFYVWLRPD